MPRFLCLLVLLLTLVFPTISRAQSSTPPPAVSLPGTELHTLHAEATQNDYRIYIALPSNYSQSDTTRYPVLYFLDADWVFALVTQAYRMQRVGQEVSEAILVGIGYSTDSIVEMLALRTLDMTPTQVSAQEEQLSAAYGQAVSTGGAAAFLSALTDEIIPFIEENYRAASDRMFAGYSFGGLFGAYVLFHEPEHFDGYMLGSPSLWWDDGVSFRYEEQYAASHRELPARVFLSVGSLESERMVPPMQQLTAVLTARAYEGFQLTTFVFEEETHLSGIAATLSRALRVLLPIAGEEE